VLRARLHAVVGGVLLSAAALPAAAQLRPLEPTSLRALSPDVSLTAELGASRLSGQRASLAGTEGVLTEAGNFALTWRTGRVALEIAGTAQRYFHETSAFAAADPQVVPSADGRRRDMGDLRIGTSLRLTPDSARVTGLLRFGTRLPTTDNTTGLDRDATDFFLALGAIARRGALVLGAEAGIGINGTREPRFEQDDLLLYTVRAELTRGWFTPGVTILGQMHGGEHPPIRAVEDLGEVRVGVRVGSRRWLRVEAVRGYAPFSPSGGVRVSAGVVR
jgi:hypothetical protein